jgi:TRAP transporter 4TM/12TM fusion protein
VTSPDQPPSGDLSDAFERASGGIAASESMSEPPPRIAGAVAVSETAPARELGGWPARLIAVLGFGLAAYALYWVVGIVAPQLYRPTFLLVALVITFLRYPGRVRALRRVDAWDWCLVALTVVVLGWPIVDGVAFGLRAATPTGIDVTLGTVLVLLVLEAARRTVGPVLPITAIAFLAYAQAGPWLDRVGLSLIAHRGYSPARVVGTLYMTLEGILGVPLDVTATYIVLFTIYGAVVEHSGAGRFFVDWAMALVGRAGGSGPGRTVTVAGYLLGAVSGSGVANTVMLGSVSWPMMRHARYPADMAGAILAAAGIGAILAPPVMGAAAFLIAEFLNVPYLEVVKMAVIPAALYYLAIVATVEADSRRLALGDADEAVPALGTVTRAGWPYFTSIVTIAAAMIQGVTAFRAVFFATMVAVAVSFITRAGALTPRRLAAALSAGGLSVVPVVATTATAGIIVGVVTLTGLGLKAASVIVALAGGSVALTVIYAALAVWVLGLAVPVTACYIIAAVMVAPALAQVGVSTPASHMFVFYYAVLSEVSPPTALSPFAAAAITGGSPFWTTMLTWKYAVPAFVVPITFTLGTHGEALLMRGSPVEVLWVAAAAALGLAATAFALGGHARGPASPLERLAAADGGALLLTADVTLSGVGLMLLAGAAAVHLGRTRVARVGVRAAP